MAGAAQGCRAVPYSRRRPEHTVLYPLVQQHLQPDPARAREEDGDGRRVPAYVERAFRRYLACGLLA